MVVEVVKEVDVSAGTVVVGTPVDVVSGIVDVVEDSHVVVVSTVVVVCSVVVVAILGKPYDQVYGSAGGPYLQLRQSDQVG